MSPHDPPAGGPAPAVETGAEGAVLWQGLRLVSGYARLHPVPFAVSVAAASVYAVMTVLGAAVLGRLTDDVIIPGFAGEVPARTLWGAVAAIMVVALLRAGGVSLRRYFAGMTARRMQVTWRRRLAATYLDMPLDTLRNRNAGELLAHVDNDVLVGTEAINPLPFSIAVVLIIVLSAVQLAVIDGWMLLVGLTLFPLITLLSHLYSRRVVRPAAEVQARVATVSAVAHESIDGAMVVKTLGREDLESERLDAAAAELRAARIRFGDLRAVFEPVLDALPNLGAVVLTVVGAWRVAEGAVTPGQVVQALALFQVLAFPVRVLGYFLEEIPPSVVASGRLRRAVSEPVPPALADEVPLPPGPLGVDVRDLAVVLDGRPVLRGLSFTVAPGETVAVVGSTGSGKSTLFNVLSGLTPATAGSVRVGGVDIERARPEDRQSAIGMVFQESFLFTGTIVANIEAGRAVSNADIERAARIARAHDFITATPRGYETVVGERGVTLSGGQRQRVALARALVARPRLVLLDDATSAVDPVVEQEILAGLTTELDATTVVVAHRLSTIRLADRVVFVRNGRVEGEGDHFDLVECNPHYAALALAYSHGVVEV